ncbi:glyoxalase superfamily protein [Sulfitobacter sp. MF3-043]|uniref:glyoxalase superfamily protein n=1 Tax=Sulfitobacter sediminivivens TaxID=3252902 RepID=UPI0036DA82CE
MRSFDETATGTFYLDFLGFDLVFEHRSTTDTRLYMGVKKDECALHLSEWGQIGFLNAQ